MFHQKFLDVKRFGEYLPRRVIQCQDTLAKEEADRMDGMLDTQSRIAFAREHAERLRGVMMASQSPKQQHDAGRREPARAPRPARVALPWTYRGTL